MGFSQASMIFFSLQVSCILFLGLIDNFEDGALRNLTFFNKFLPWSLVLEKNVSQDLLTLSRENSATFLWKETTSRLLFYSGNQLTLSSWKKSLPRLTQIEMGELCNFLFPSERNFSKFLFYCRSQLTLS